VLLVLQMADAYYHGLRNVPIDVERAGHLYEQAAWAGDERAQIQVAKMHMLGQRRTDNQTFLKTVRQLNRTAEGTALLAHLHATGAANIPQDVRLSTELFRQAAAMPGGAKLCILFFFFSVSYFLSAGATVLTNLGLMERSLGHRAAAWSHFTLAAARHDT
jgi:TPR repeat protein